MSVKVIDASQSNGALTATFSLAPARPDCGSIADARWYCVRSNYRAEIFAYSELSDAGFVAFLPLYMSRKRGHEPKILPYYPRYLFVAFDRDLDQWRKIFSTRGVEHMFMLNQTTPAPIPRGVIEALIVKSEIGGGYIDDERQAAPDLKGKTIHVINGALTAHTGLVSASTDERVTVLLSLLGRSVSVDLARSDIQVLR